jgi:hypothetical protein
MHTVDLTGKTQDELINIITNAGMTGKKWKKTRKNRALRKPISEIRKECQKGFNSIRKLISISLRTLGIHLKVNLTIISFKEDSNRRISQVRLMRNKLNKWINQHLIGKRQRETVQAVLGLQTERGLTKQLIVSDGLGRK